MTPQHSTGDRARTAIARTHHPDGGITTADASRLRRTWTALFGERAGLPE
ncbi:hypothetical protein EGH21_14730 [Halomicroarcula sp. F13]|uniref:Uncharacterized protein n=1 Tax=Haloarcula rubra TaxID=2487747 RepID=A0AAW4PVA0_9EURY|nr:hypothetical protein [Halomicroarcula rubra]MBX0324283.1 hypothetical protein [Halomicroarcula rubra]